LILGEFRYPNRTFSWVDRWHFGRNDNMVLTWSMGSSAARTRRRFISFDCCFCGVVLVRSWFCFMVQKPSCFIFQDGFFCK
jgi:hypothetical protein